MNCLEITPEQETQYNEILRSLIPELHKRLKASHWDELAHWIETDDFSGAILEAENIDFIVENVIDAIESPDSFGLDLDGYIGFIPFTVLDDESKKQIETFIKEIVLKRSAKTAVKDAIDRILHAPDSFSCDEDLSHAAFFVFGLLETQKKSRELQMLWILESSYEDHAYMFEIEDGQYIDFIWNICRDILPPEIIEILDYEN